MFISLRPYRGEWFQNRRVDAQLRQSVVLPPLRDGLRVLSKVLDKLDPEHRQMETGAASRGGSVTTGSQPPVLPPAASFPGRDAEQTIDKPGRQRRFEDPGKPCVEMIEHTKDAAHVEPIESEARGIGSKVFFSRLHLRKRPDEMSPTRSQTVGERPDRIVGKKENDVEKVFAFENDEIAIFRLDGWET